MGDPGPKTHEGLDSHLRGEQRAHANFSILMENELQEKQILIKLAAN